MPVCRLCPGRLNFMNEGALRIHQESKHGYSGCQICNRAFAFKAALHQHMVDKHPRCYSCNTCGTVLRSQQALDHHTEAKHRHRYYCGTCGTVLRSQQALDQHREAKHRYRYRCGACGTVLHSQQALDKHREAEHPQRHHCDTCGTALHSKEALDQHRTDKHAPSEWMLPARVPSPAPGTQGPAKHPLRLECQHCDLRFTTDDARRDHEVAEHPPVFECRHCDSDFTSDNVRLQHENAKHKESHQEHEDAKHNETFQCSHCSLKFHTIHEKDAHEKSHHLSSTVVSSPSVTQPQPSYSSSLSPPPINSKPSHVSDTQGKQLASPGTSQCSHAEVDESSHDPAESQTSDEETSSLDEEDISHPSDDGPSIARSQDLICRSAIYEQPCTWSISQRPPTSPLSSACDDDKFDDLPDDASSIASGGGDGQDGPAEDFQAACLCIFCSQVFDTDEDPRGHICASRGTIFQFAFHCSFCYTQFDDESSLLKHLEEDRISFRCHLCQMLSCSNDMLQDHLLDHPACCKCGKVFIDDLALCNHVGSEHPIVVCWDCDGAVVEQDSLAVSPEHPSCTFCGVGKRISDDMEEHIKNQHATELHDSTPNDIAVSQSNGQAAIDSSSNTTSDEESVLVEKQPATDNEDGLGPEALGEPEPEPPSPTSVETPMHEEHHEPHTSPPQTEPSLSLTIAPLLCSAALLLLFVIRRRRRK